jgi:hypothetical protein
MIVIASDRRERSNPALPDLDWIASSALPPRNDGEMVARTLVTS